MDESEKINMGARNRRGDVGNLLAFLRVSPLPFSGGGKRRDAGNEVVATSYNNYHNSFRFSFLITCALKRDAQVVFCKGFFGRISHSPRTPLGHDRRRSI